MKNFILFLLKLRKFSYRGYGSPNVRIRKFSTVTFLLLTLLPTAAFSTTNYDPGANGNIGGFQGTNATSYTPTITGFGTPTSVNFSWRRDGQFIIITGTGVTGTTAASLMSFSLPTGLSIDSTANGPTNTSGQKGKSVGILSCDDGGQQTGLVLTATGTSTTLLYAGAGLDGTNPLTPANGSNLCGSSDTFSFTASVPISGWSAGGAGGATLPRSMVIVDSGNGSGSTNTMIRRWSNVRLQTGSDIVYADSATLGGSFTIQTTGIYSVTYTDARSSGVGVVGITVNDAAPTADVTNPITYADGLRGGFTTSSGGNVPATISWTGILTAGDVVRGHHNGFQNFTNATSVFSIVKVSN